MNTCAMCGEKYRGKVHMCQNWPPVEKAGPDAALVRIICWLWLLLWLVIMQATCSCTSQFAIKGTETPKVRKAADGHYGWGHTAHFHNINH